MSHFVTLVFTKENGRTVEELLAPYDEDIVYAPYVLYTREQAIAKIRKEIEDYKNGFYAEYLSNPKKYEESHSNVEHINYLKNEFPKKLEWTDDECYEDIKRSFDEDMVKSNGDLLSIYNPNSKWNWYTIGGRFNNYLKTLSGKTINEDYVSKIVGKIYYLLPLLLLLENGTNEAKWVGGLVFSMKKATIIGRQNLKNFLAV